MKWIHLVYGYKWYNIIYLLEQKKSEHFLWGGLHPGIVQNTTTSHACTHKNIFPLRHWKVYFQQHPYLKFQSETTIQNTNRVTHPRTSVSHLLFVSWDPFGLDSAQSKAGQHVVQELSHENLHTVKNTTLSISFQIWTSWGITLPRYTVLLPCFILMPD